MYASHVTRTINSIKLANFPGTRTEFRYVSKLSETNQGVIFCAEITATGQSVAIKVAHAHLVDNHLSIKGKTIPEDFLKERRHTLYLTETLSSEQNPIIQALDEWDETDEQGQVIAYCLMLEFIPGGKDLFDMGAEKWAAFRRTRDPRPVETWFENVHQIFRELVSAVELLHENGIVHLDLSPENVLVDKDGHIRVIDLGTSEFWRANGEEEKDGEEAEALMFCRFRGKLAYCAPEVHEKAVKYDGRAADVFSMGTILLFMLGGVADQTRKELYWIQRHGFGKWLKKYNRDFVPSDAIALVDKLLARENERPSMRELTEDRYVVQIVDWADGTLGMSALNTDGFDSVEEVVA